MPLFSYIISLSLSLSVSVSISLSSSLVSHSLYSFVSPLVVIIFFPCFCFQLSCLALPAAGRGVGASARLPPPSLTATQPISHLTQPPLCSLPPSLPPSLSLASCPFLPLWLSNYLYLPVFLYLSLSLSLSLCFLLLPSVFFFSFVFFGFLYIFFLGGGHF